MKKILSLIKLLHSNLVLNRRSDILSKNISNLIPYDSIVLDIGCGDGTIGHLVMQHKPSIFVSGLEVMKRSNCRIKCKMFDGLKIPLKDSSVDVCILVDVLHHTLNIEGLLKEACRISRKYVIIKDHLYNNKIDFAILKFMDWIGNRPYGVGLVYNYQNKQKWSRYFESCRLQTIKWNDKIPLYIFPFNAIFGRNLHFISLLEKERTMEIKNK